MGLRGWLLRRAAVRPPVLVVAGSYGTRVRLLVEAAGWPVARSPASAGVLVTCGADGASAEAAGVVWADMAGPRARVVLGRDATGARVRAALEEAREVLAGWDAGADPGIGWVPGGGDSHERSCGGGPPDEGSHERSCGGGPPDEGSPGMPGEEGHGCGAGMPAGDGHGSGSGHEHHMGSPGGLPMAGRGPDRDGLTLDRLHVPLGPVLADWPDGLVVETVMQGDVIQEARVRLPDSAGSQGARSFWDEPWLAAAAGEPVTRDAAERRRAAAHLDSLGRFLAVAGWPAAAGSARHMRDRLLWASGSEGSYGFYGSEGSGGFDVEDGSDDKLVAGYARFARRVGGSRVLAWMTRGLGPLEPAADGDVLGRVHHWLTATGAALGHLGDLTPLADDLGPRGPVGQGRSGGSGRSGRSGGSGGSRGSGGSAAALDALPGLLAGAELGAARLIVAALDPDLAQLSPAAAHA
ncbi:hypothetical protein [Nonomuraea typhae]|uniref:Uncharacterized protein n=1 Tax=Nonomuraea typhae TaxID=2603600 RepID=A0ABW7YLK4_9ACTN